MQMEEHKPLAPFTTFGIGGPARWFTRAQNEDDIVAASEWARCHAVPLFVLGGGSNLLVADTGFDGLVLHIALTGLESHSENNKTIFRVAAGEDWDTFVQRTVEANCSGLECLAGIPGTVGGTPVQNVGAYGQEVATTIARVRAFDLVTGSFVEFTPEECGFAYRRSRFNTVDRGRFIVTRVDYCLTPGGAPSLRYAELLDGVVRESAFVDAADPQGREQLAAWRALGLWAGGRPTWIGTIDYVDACDAAAARAVRAASEAEGFFPFVAGTLDHLSGLCTW